MMIPVSENKELELGDIVFDKKELSDSQKYGIILYNITKTKTIFWYDSVETIKKIHKNTDLNKNFTDMDDDLPNIRESDKTENVYDIYIVDKLVKKSFREQVEVRLKNETKR